jgi:hypothetical protein
MDKSEGTLSEGFGVSVSCADLLTELSPGIHSKATRGLLAEAAIDASSLSVDVYVSERSHGRYSVSQDGPTLCTHGGQAGFHPLGHSQGQSEWHFKSLSCPKAKQAAREVSEKMLADPSLMLIPTCIAAVHYQSTQQRSPDYDVSNAVAR